MVISIEEEADGAPIGGECTYEQLEQVSKQDVVAIRALFEICFPIRYGDQFYQGLEAGMYAGKHLMSFIARRDGQVIGCACASKEMTDHHSPETVVVMFGSTAYLMTLAVNETERRRGVASKLMQHMLEWAKCDTLCTAAYLHVIEYNTSAMEFYRKLGFEQYAKEENFYPQLNGKDYAAMVYVARFNGGTAPMVLQEPSSSGGSILDFVFDWITYAFGKLFSGGPMEEINEHASSKEAGALV